MCAKEKFYSSLVSIMGAPELADDPRFRTFADRLENREVLGPILKDLSRKQTTARWLELLRGEVPCAPVNTVEEALADPQVAEDDMIATVQHPTLGEISQPANPIKIGGAPPDHRPGPALGQDTDQVLRDYAGASPARSPTGAPPASCNAAQPPPYRRKHVPYPDTGPVSRLST